MTTQLVWKVGVLWCAANSLGAGFYIAKGLKVLDLTLVCRVSSKKAFNQRCFTSSIRAKKGKDLAFVDFKIDALQDFTLVVILMQSRDL